MVTVYSQIIVSSDEKFKIDLVEVLRVYHALFNLSRNLVSLAVALFSTQDSLSAPLCMVCLGELVARDFVTPFGLHFAFTFRFYYAVHSNSWTQGVLCHQQQHEQHLSR